MTHDEALAFLGPAGPWGGDWADVGAGDGTFTRALAELLGPQDTVYAIDRDQRAVADLQRLAGPAGRDAVRADRNETGGARITALRGDMQELSALAGLDGVDLDGILFANVLHFTNEPAAVLAQAAGRVRPAGRIVVIEYDRNKPNPWVPHPLPFDRLADAARRAGLGVPEEVARRPSAYHREMYCAVLAVGPLSGHAIEDSAR
jgi:SAM-dependent methyltransferase